MAFGRWIPISVHIYMRNGIKDSRLSPAQPPYPISSLTTLCTRAVCIRYAVEDLHGGKTFVVGPHGQASSCDLERPGFRSGQGIKVSIHPIPPGPFPVSAPGSAGEPPTSAATEEARPSRTFFFEVYENCISAGGASITVDDYRYIYIYIHSTYGAPTSPLCEPRDHTHTPPLKRERLHGVRLHQLIPYVHMPVPEWLLD